MITKAYDCGVLLTLTHCRGCIAILGLDTLQSFTRLHGSLLLDIFVMVWVHFLLRVRVRVS